MKKMFTDSLKKKINRIIRRSIDFALIIKKSSLKFITYHAQEMDDNVVQAHINLYVNNFTDQVRFEGKNSIKELFKSASIDPSEFF